MASNFVVWLGGLNVDEFCVLDEIEVRQAVDLNEAVSLAAEWPADASAKMSPDFKRQIRLADSLKSRHLVASLAMKQALEAASAVTKVEFLPLTVINHKGRVASRDYFVVNALQVVDCIDVKASKPVYNDIDPESIMYFKKHLVLNEEAIPKTAKLFRAKHYTTRTLMRRDVAERMKAAGLVGLNFKEPATYKG